MLKRRLARKEHVALITRKLALGTIQLISFVVMLAYLLIVTMALKLPNQKKPQDFHEYVLKNVGILKITISTVKGRCLRFFIGLDILP